MSHKPGQVLEQIFAHPLVMNIKWRDVTHLLESMGAQTEVVHGGREKVRLNGCEHTFHIPHGRTLDSKEQLLALRRFLQEAGAAPSAG